VTSKHKLLFFSLQITVLCSTETFWYSYYCPYKLLCQSHPNIYFWQSTNKPELIWYWCEETIDLSAGLPYEMSLLHRSPILSIFAPANYSQHGLLSAMRCCSSISTVGFRGTTSYPSQTESCQVRRTRGQYVQHAQSIYQEALRCGRQGRTCRNVTMCYHVEKWKCHERDVAGLASGYFPA
jgi:hypothetical protein